MADDLDWVDTVCVQIAHIQNTEAQEFAGKAKAGPSAPAHQPRPQFKIINGDQVATAMALIENTSRVVKEITELPPEPPPPGTLLNARQ